jgi:16S rRNA (adenine1518-N6/adenine1519-N6)-dimethyltransferase
MLQANGLRPRRQYGQNFLIDLNLLDLLVDAAGIGKGDVVLEVGAGTGGLTNRLSAAAAEVVSVEIDPGFHELAQKETAGCDNVTFVHRDVLKNKNTMEPAVLEAVAAALERTGARHYRLVANLPYDVSAMVIGNLLLESLPVRSMTVTVQFEMGQRIVAPPEQKDYGPLSVLVALLGEVTWVRTLPPTVFWPRPKVTSAILTIDVTRRPRGDGAAAELEHLRRFNRFCRNLFMHRRKSLRPAVARIPGYKEFKKDVDPLLESLDLDGRLRAEQLKPQELLKLFRALEAMRTLPATGELDAPDE